MSEQKIPFSVQNFREFVLIDIMERKNTFDIYHPLNCILGSCTKAFNYFAFDDNCPYITYESLDLSHDLYYAMVVGDDWYLKTNHEEKKIISRYMTAERVVEMLTKVFEGELNTPTKIQDYILEGLK